METKLWHDFHKSIPLNIDIDVYNYMHKIQNL